MNLVLIRKVYWEPTDEASFYPRFNSCINQQRRINSANNCNWFTPFATTTVAFLWTRSSGRRITAINSSTLAIRSICIYLTVFNFLRTRIGDTRITTITSPPPTSSSIERVGLIINTAVAAAAAAAAIFITTAATAAAFTAIGTPDRWLRDLPEGILQEFGCYLYSWCFSRNMESKDELDGKQQSSKRRNHLPSNGQVEDASRKALWSSAKGS